MKTISLDWRVVQAEAARLARELGSGEVGYVVLPWPSVWHSSLRINQFPKAVSDE